MLLRRLSALFWLLCLAVLLSGCGSIGRIGITTNEDAYLNDKRGH